jgi:hypothetical protein
MSIATDSISSHITLNIREKVWANKYVNLSLLLKPASVLLDISRGRKSFLHQMGPYKLGRQAHPERIKSVEQWTDAFVIIIDIYIMQTAPELLSYMSTIRQATYRRNDFAWRTYDEQFRLRQENFYQPWSKLNADLWLKTMTFPNIPAKSDITNKPPTNQNPTPAICRYFNTSKCTSNPCKFKHVCAVCGKPHSKLNCYSFLNSQKPSKQPSNAKK